MNKAILSFIFLSLVSSVGFSSGDGFSMDLQYENRLGFKNEVQLLLVGSHLSVDGKHFRDLSPLEHGLEISILSSKASESKLTKSCGIGSYTVHGRKILGSRKTQWIEKGCMDESRFSELYHAVQKLIL